MAYADVDPIGGHLQSPALDLAGDIVQIIASQSPQVAAVDWIFEKVTGISLIETVVTPISGDWARIAANGQAWRSVGSALEAISNNLSANVDTLQQHWSGAASDSFGSHIRTVWSGALKAEAGLATLIGEGFEVVAEVSRQLGQETVDLLEKLVNKLIEAIAMLPIPYVGWARAVQLVWEGFQIFQQIMGIIQAIKGVIDTAQQLFDAVGQIRNALEMIPDVRNVGDALSVASALTGGMSAAASAAQRVQDNVDAGRATLDRSSNVPSGTRQG
jgi:uncharacterized protein YukE